MGLGATLAAQDPGTFGDPARASLAPAPLPGGASGGSNGAGTAAADLVRASFQRLAPAAAPGLHAAAAAPTSAPPAVPRLRDLLRQEPDYSLRGLFQQAHGDFMLRRERFDPIFEVGGMAVPNTSIQHEPGRFDLWRFTADLEAPVVVSPDAYLEFGAFGESRHYEVRDMPGFGDETVYSAGLVFGFGFFLDENTLLEAQARPGSWSDWDGTLHSDDYDCPASVLVTVRSTEDFFWKIGVRYNEIYEDANVLPYLGLSWFSEEFRVDVLLPEYIEASYWPSTDFGILGGVEIQGAEYRVRSSAASGRQQADLRVQEVLVYGGAQWRFDDYLSLRSRVGIAAAGDYKLDDGIGATPRIDGTLKTGLFVDVTMGIDW